MSRPGRARLWLRTAFAWTIGVVYTVFWASLGIATWPLSPGGNLYLKFARIWSGWILASLWIPWSVEGRGRLDRDRSYLFMSNHESTFDIFALFVATEHPLRMVAKKELFYIPILGWSMWMCGFVPIDRSNRERAIESLERAAEKIRKGISVLVFPEGTRNHGRGLLPFKKGGFVMALRAEAPVVPVVVKGTRSIKRKGDFRVHPGSIEVRFGDPIETVGRGVEARDDLMGEVREAMVELGAGRPEGSRA